MPAQITDMNLKQTIFSISVFILLLMPAFQAAAQTDNDDYNVSNIQLKGNNITGGNFTGSVWVNMIVMPDDSLNTVAGKVMFEPKARSNWHSHAGGQILIVTKGVGYYQEEGKPIRIIREGDVVKAPANVQHWHGGSHGLPMTHTAIVPDLDEGRTTWAGPVTDQEYDQALEREGKPDN